MPVATLQQDPSNDQEWLEVFGPPVSPDLRGDIEDTSDCQKNVYLILSWTCSNLVLLFFLFHNFWWHYCGCLTLLEWCHGTKIVSDVLAVLCSTKQSTWESLRRPACRDEASWAALLSTTHHNIKEYPTIPATPLLGPLCFTLLNRDVGDLKQPHICSPYLSIHYDFFRKSSHRSNTQMFYVSGRWHVVM